MEHADTSKNLSHPEIEALSAYEKLPLLVQEVSKDPPTTYVDLLEIPGNLEEKVLWKTGIDHGSLTEHFKFSDSSDSNGAPVLRILFVNALRSTGRARSQLHPSTISWMRDRFALSPIFVKMLLIGSTMDTNGSSSFLNRDDNGNAVSIVVSYTILGTSCLVWFCYHFKPRTPSYIVVECPVRAKSLILECALGGCPSSLSRICAIDVFVMMGRSEQVEDMMPENSRAVLRHENMRIESELLSPREMATAVEDLHRVSKNLHGTFAELADVEELSKFLSNVHERCMSHLPNPWQNESVEESLGFLITKTRAHLRYIRNVIDRTDIRINLFYNLTSQRDNRTNLEIANFTSKIAVDTQRDSSSMITIAAVTMFFLPGTFVSALFSMVFFNSETDSHGRTSLTVSPQWWYFIAITIPLTILVFFVWIVWRHWRNQVKGIGNTTVASTDEKF